MSLTVNLRHLEHKNLEIEGELTIEELDFGAIDPLIHLQKPLTYVLEIQKYETNILVQGELTLPLECECVRCLKRFAYTLELAEWDLLLPLEGEDAVKIISDTVDLTPYVREDMLLGFPQHPLCEPECGGLQLPSAEATKLKPSDQAAPGASVWAALDQLKLNE